MTPPVIVHCITYNHAAFIRQALDSFLMQKTTFPFEVYISDDASTDQTPQILQEYAARYPQKIKIFLHEKNQGMTPNFLELVARIHSPYVCMCEGDDYWTDPLKLEKQKQFLDTHPECSMVFHPAKIYWQAKQQFDGVWGPRPGVNKSLEEQLWEENIIPTFSVMYRWRFNKEDLSLFPRDILPLDWYMHMLHAQVGRIGFLPEEMGVYRRHDGGIWWNILGNETCFVKYFWQQINFFICAEKQFGKDYSAWIVDRFLALMRFCRKNRCSAVYQEVYRQAPQVWKSLAQRFDDPQKSLALAFLKWKLCATARRNDYKMRYLTLKVGKFLQQVAQENA